MNFANILQPIFDQLSASLIAISATNYSKKCTQLNGSSIGSHTRHIIELFQCLINGYTTATINYENRKRDLSLEVDKNMAIQLLQQILATINAPNRDLLLHTNTDYEVAIQTNYYREIIYNMEHCIHHMALIRVALSSIKNIALPESYGVAASTLKYRETCAQ
jgi:hypothetical protein